MLNGWPECIDDLFSVSNVSYSCQLLVLSARVLRCSTLVLVALPHLHNVADIGHSLHLSILCLFHYFKIMFSFHQIYCLVIATHYPIFCKSKLLYNNQLAKGFTCGFRLDWADNVLNGGKTGLHFNAMRYDRDNIVCHIREISVLWMCVLLLRLPVGDNPYSKCSATLPVVRVVIIVIWIHWPPVLLWLWWWIQIEPCSWQ